MTYDKILLPTDGRAATEGALLRALDLARGLGASVHALYVVNTGGSTESFPAGERETLTEFLGSRGRQATVDVQNEASELDVEVSREIREGIPSDEILACAEEQDADLITMGTRGRVADLHLGSTTRRVLARATIPVLAVPYDESIVIPDNAVENYDRLVIATDGSDASERVADHALQIAERYGAEVLVVYVVDTDTYSLRDAPRSIVGILKEGGKNALEAVAADARERNVPVETTILRGVPEDAILQYTAGAGGDLIAVGAGARTGDDRYFLGSTTARILRRSSVPVLTTR